MCTGKCSRFIGVALYPLALTSIICNIILFFPGWDVQYAKDGNITQEVKYMGGLKGGGMVLITALYIHLTGKRGCCANRCGMFLLSIAFAAVGVVGALYSFAVNMVGLINGPYCKVGLIWMTPFKDKENSYLNDQNLWFLCTSPENVIQFNIALFSTLVAVSGVEAILCAIQMINSLFGCLCGTCKAEGLYVNG